MASSTDNESDDVCLLRIGFENGLFTRDHVRAWVDRQLQALNDLPEELLALATIAHTHDYDVSKLLRALEGSPPPKMRARFELSVLSALHRERGGAAGYCVEHLCALANRIDGFTDEELSRIHAIECAYYLAVEGTYGTLDEVERDLDQFLSAYRLPTHLLRL